MAVFEQRLAPMLSPTPDQPAESQEIPHLWPTCCCNAMMTRSRILRLGRDSACDLTLCQEQRREKSMQMALQ